MLHTEMSSERRHRICRVSLFIPIGMRHLILRFYVHRLFGISIVQVWTYINTNHDKRFVRALVRKPTIMSLPLIERQ